MKKTLFALIGLAWCLNLAAQERMFIYKNDKQTLGARITETDSIYFTDNQTMACFKVGDTLATYATTSIDSINFGPDTDTVFISFYGNSVYVFNPFAFEGVNVAINGSDVTITATIAQNDINYCLKGVAADGMFKIYSDKRFNLIMNGVGITNLDGPAINIQSNEKASVYLVPGTYNTLTDGATYATPPNNEDQGAAFFAEGTLLFKGTGHLTINGKGTGKQGLGADDRIEITSGTLSIASAVKDGIHANDGVLISGGTLNVTASGDGIDGDAAEIVISGGNITIIANTDDVKGIKCDSTLLISGGVLNITVAGDQSKGLKSGQAMTLSGGTINIVNAGDAVLEASGSGYDPSYSTAIKSDTDVNISGANIAITASGKAGKGISADGSINISAGSVQVVATGNGATYTNASGVKDAYVSTGLSADVNISISGGSVTTSSSGSGGKGFSCDGALSIGTTTSSPSIEVTTTGSKILISGSGSNATYAEAKAIKSDGDVLINNGIITLNSADDGIKSETSITINGGELNINNSIEGIEAPSITLNGGTTHVTSSDDCINATFGNGGEFDDGSLFTANNGYLAVNTTGGDGLDSNGDILIAGGTVIVHGPPSNPEVGMDYNGSCNVNGGFLVISGTNSNMTQAPSTSSQQYSIKAMSNQQLSATTLFHLQDASGNNLLTFQPKRAYYSIVFSSSSLVNGASYSIYTGGSCSGTATDGLYSGGTYSGGTLKKQFTINGKVTNVSF